MMVVIGCNSESRHDFRRNVGIISRPQVEVDVFRMACLTSSVVAGMKVVKGGGDRGGIEDGKESAFGLTVEQSLEIF